MSDEVIVVIIAVAIFIGMAIALFAGIYYKGKEFAEDRRKNQEHNEKWSIYEKVIRCRKCKTYSGAIEALESDGVCPHCGGKGPIHPLGPENL
jgi:hypothetical protein